jgi:hypothetical protein
LVGTFPLFRGAQALLLVVLTIATACHSRRSETTETISVGTLSHEYERSIDDVRKKLDGKEITVKGHAESAAALPQSVNDQGSLSLQETAGDRSQRVVCWFSGEQVTAFSKLRADQSVTVKGVFNGESGANLKFCKLVKVEE